MDTSTAVVQAELTSRRAELEKALISMGRPAALLRLLEEVDGALQRIEHGTYGLCEACHDPIERHWLAADPLARFCLDHLGAEQRAALEQDLALASAVQRGLLPRNDLNRNGWEISYQYQPAGPVGGDYCDVFIAGEDVVFLLGDASGKGIASSLLASQLHAVFRTLCAGTLPLAQIMARANRIICESTLTSHYATVVCGRAKAGGEIEIASAGHCPPLQISDGRVVPLEATGLPLGLFCSAEFTTHHLRFGPYGCLLLYSDGLIEARNPSGCEYGLEALHRVAASAINRSASHLFAEEIVEDWNRFRAGAPSGDDLTVMVIRRGER